MHSSSSRPMLLEDLLAHAKVIHLCEPSGSCESKLAISWLVKNRTTAAIQYRQTHHKRHPQFGDGTISSACYLILESLNADQIDILHPQYDHLPWKKRAFLRSVQAAITVWIGDVPDIIHGATLFHSHRENPKWSEKMQPVALIGNFFFYSLQPSSLTVMKPESYPKYLH